ncbi:hypothetical protein [Guptibacillus algicola]|uniref:hypothetical protein n=1 Tax=Guptibacillus algicola TaxID=225844 RepID=UPI001CD740AA|nr:hypothetical protein [Alkalihalobacillus algicola]MCA0987849.1 hypothetical protein [Alkalihalobacillus algicola]
MRSLFDDTCCGKSPTSNCKGCVCNVLQRMANGNNCDIWEDNMTVVYLLPKGQTGYMYMSGEYDPTPFTFMGMESNSCCARFRYTDVNGNPRTAIIDCSTLAGISRVSE